MAASVKTVTSFVRFLGPKSRWHLVTGVAGIAATCTKSLKLQSLRPLRAKIDKVGNCDGRPDLHNLLQIVQRGFCMCRSDIDMALLTLVDRFLQMVDGVCCVWICVNPLTGFRVRERRLGMRS